MKLQERIIALSNLGDVLKNKDEFFESIDFDKIEKSNPWFIPEYVKFSFCNWSKLLDYDMICKWIEPYSLHKIRQKKRVLIILAGNIPLVGFHDFLSVLLSGHDLVVKMAKKDSHLLKLLVEKINGIDSRFKQKIDFVDDFISEDIDAVIATGSENSERYFEYFFSNKKRIIRENKRSIAILSGDETDAQLECLADDIFMYFGLGCRNVSKIFVPEGYDFTKLFNSFDMYKKSINHKKYRNNYIYNKAIAAMNNYMLIDNGFLLMKEEKSIYSPVAMLHYEYFKDYNKVLDSVNTNNERIQCLVSANHTIFGRSQKPNLLDYADGIDTISFLKSI